MAPILQNSTVGSNEMYDLVYPIYPPLNCAIHPANCSCDFPWLRNVVSLRYPISNGFYNLLQHGKTISLAMEQRNEKCRSRTEVLSNSADLLGVTISRWVTEYNFVKYRIRDWFSCFEFLCVLTMMFCLSHSEC